MAVDDKEKNRIYYAQYREKNREKIRENALRWYYKNAMNISEEKKYKRKNNINMDITRKKNRERMQEYRNENREKVNELRRQNYQNNKERECKRQRDYKKNNEEKIMEYNKKYKSSNRDKLTKQSNEYIKKRRSSDTSFKIIGNTRSKIRIALISSNMNKTEKTTEMLGCTIQFLKKYLESKFKPGMTWENYGRQGWHIDHIRPCASFDLTKKEERLKCFHFTNLQPLWAIDNLKKGKKYYTEEVAS